MVLIVISIRILYRKQSFIILSRSYAGTCIPEDSGAANIKLSRLRIDLPPLKSGFISSRGITGGPVNL